MYNRRLTKSIFCNATSNSFQIPCLCNPYWAVAVIMGINYDMKFVAIWLALLFGNVISLVVLFLSTRKLQRETRHTLIALCFTQLAMGLRHLYTSTNESDKSLELYNKESLWKMTQVLCQLQFMGNILLLNNLICFSFVIRIQFVNFTKELRKYYSSGRIIFTLVLSFFLSAMATKQVSLSYCLKTKRVHLYLTFGNSRKNNLMFGLITGFVTANVIVASVLVCIAYILIKRRMVSKENMDIMSANNTWSNCTTVSVLKASHLGIFKYMVVVNVLQYIFVVPYFVMSNFVSNNLRSRDILRYVGVVAAINFNCTAILAILLLPSLRKICFGVFKCRQRKNTHH